MSLKNGALFFGLIVVGLAGGAGLMFFQKPASPSRQVASDLNAWRPSGVGKHLAPITVEIIQPAALPDRDDQEVELTGLVTLNSATDNDVNFQWALPDGVSVVDGESEDAWSGVKVGQTAVTKISVVGFSKEQHRVISLEAYVQMGDHRLGNSSTLASNNEGSAEARAPKMMRVKQQQEEQEAEKARRH